MANFGGIMNEHSCGRLRELQKKKECESKVSRAIEVDRNVSKVPRTREKGQLKEADEPEETHSVCLGRPGVEVI
jgi:hypothetical protein